MNDHEAPPELWSQDRVNEQIRKITQSVRGMLKGRTNNVYKVDLPATGASTDVVNPDLTGRELANLTPLTAAAAANMSTTYAVVSQGRITIHHADGIPGRTVGVIVAG